MVDNVVYPRLYRVLIDLFFNKSHLYEKVYSIRAKALEAVNAEFATMFIMNGEPGIEQITLDDKREDIIFIYTEAGKAAMCEYARTGQTANGLPLIEFDNYNGFPIPKPVA